MKKRTFILTLTGLGLATALFASGMDHQRFEEIGDMQRSHMMGSKHVMFGKLMKQLDLSDTQRTEIRSLMKIKRQEMKEKFQSFKEERKALRKSFDASQFMSAEHFDKEAFKEVLRKRRAAIMAFMQEHQEEMLENRANTMQKIFDILTPEQREKVIQLSQKR